MQRSLDSIFIITELSKQLVLKTAPKFGFYLQRNGLIALTHGFKIFKHVLGSAKVIILQKYLINQEQLSKWLLRTPEDPGSNPLLSNFYSAFIFLTTFYDEEVGRD